MWPFVKKHKENLQPPSVWVNPEPGRMVNLTRAWTLSIERSDEKREAYYVYANLGTGVANRVPVAYVGDKELAKDVLRGMVRALGKIDSEILATSSQEQRARLLKDRLLTEPDEPKRLWLHWYESDVAVNLAQAVQIKVHNIDHLPPGGAAAIARGEEVAQRARGVYALFPDGEEVFLGVGGTTGPGDDSNAGPLFDALVDYLRPYGRGRYQGLRNPFAPWES